MENKTLYEKILQSLKGDIESGTLKPGDRIPTEFEIAEMFDVSRITAIRAVKELENSGLVHRIRRKGSFVCDIIEKKNDRSGFKNQIIPILLPFGESIGFEILKGAQEEAEQHGYYLTFYNADHSAKKERAVIKKLLDSDISGMIVYPCLSYDNIDLFSKMLVRKVPLVFLDRTINGIDAPYVTSNNYKGMHEMVSDLIKMGHKRIGYYCFSENMTNTETERFKGYCHAMIEAGLELKRNWIMGNHLYEKLLTKPSQKHAELQAAAAEEALDYLMSIEEKPTAIVCVNDMSAIYISKAAIKKGLAVPDDISITGFDNLQFAEHIEVPLTTVEQSFKEMGIYAVRMLLDYINGKEIETRNVVLDTKYIKRMSTASIVV